MSCSRAARPSRWVWALSGLALGVVFASGCSSRLGSKGDEGGEDTSESLDGDGDTAASAGTVGTESLSGDDDPDADAGCNADGCPVDLPPAPTLCDPWLQNCPEGEKCTTARSTPGSGTWDVNVCTPVVDDPSTPREPCELVDDGPLGMDTCDAGSMCLDVDPATGLGVCVGYCLPPAANPGCADPWAVCKQSSGSTLSVCLPACNPLLTGDCPTGQLCTATFEGEDFAGFVCFPPAAQGTGGEECTCPNCCAAGHMCTPAEDYGPGCIFGDCCTEYCDLSDPGFTCAGSGQQCVALFESAPPGFDLVGVCRVPD